MDPKDDGVVAYARVEGVLFSRSVRASFARLCLVPIEEKTKKHQSSDDLDIQQPVLIQVDFNDRIKELRSYIRRAYKLGDRINIHAMRQQTRHERGERYSIELSSTNDASQYVQILQPHFWTSTQCQKAHEYYFSGLPPPVVEDVVVEDNIDDVSKKSQSKNNTKQQKGHTSCNPHCSGGLGKRLQGQYVAKILIASVMKKLKSPDDESLGWLADSSKWSSWEEWATRSNPSYNEALEFLNTEVGLWMLLVELAMFPWRWGYWGFGVRW